MFIEGPYFLDSLIAFGGINSCVKKRLYKSVLSGCLFAIENHLEKCNKMWRSPEEQVASIH